MDPCKPSQVNVSSSVLRTSHLRHVSPSRETKPPPRYFLLVYSANPSREICPDAQRQRSSRQASAMNSEADSRRPSPNLPLVPTSDGHRQSPRWLGPCYRVEGDLPAKPKAGGPLPRR